MNFASWVCGFYCETFSVEKIVSYNASNDDICADQQIFEGTTEDWCWWFDVDNIFSTKARSY